MMWDRYFYSLIPYPIKVFILICECAVNTEADDYSMNKNENSLIWVSKWKTWFN